MMEVQVQPVDRLPLKTPEKEFLITQLDHLLERYLTTLDQYQKAQQQLTAYMCSVSSQRAFLPAFADLR
jgi:hypothetical protein